MDLIRVEKLAIVEVLRTLTPSISPIDLRLESSNLQLVSWGFFFFGSLPLARFSPSFLICFSISFLRSDFILFFLRVSVHTYIR